MKNKIHVIIKKPEEETGHDAVIDNTLDKLQEIVGGRIEVVDIGVRAGETDVRLICNETGKLSGLPGNFRIPGDVIHGTAILAGIDGEDFTDVPLSIDQWRIALQIWEKMGGIHG